MSWQHFLSFLPLPHWQGSFGFCLLSFRASAAQCASPGALGAALRVREPMRRCALLG